MVSNQCWLCAVASVASETRIYADESWIIDVPVRPVPGWVTLQSRRHTEGLWTLDEGEMRSLGVVLRDVAAAIKEVCDAERVYLIHMGESVQHFHMALGPRGADITPEERVLAHLARFMESPGDLEAAAPIARRLRSHMQRGAPVGGST